MKRTAVVSLRQRRCSCATERELYMLLSQKLNILPFHFTYWSYPQRQYYVCNTKVSASYLSTHKTNMSVFMKKANAHRLSRIYLQKRLSSSYNVNNDDNDIDDPTKYCSTSYKTSKKIVSCVSSYNYPRRFLHTLPSAISREELTNIKSHESQQEQEKHCNKLIEIEEENNNKEEEININIISFANLQSKHQSGITKLKSFLDNATCSKQKQKMHNNLQSVSDELLLSENKTFVACLVRLSHEKNDAHNANASENMLAECININIEESYEIEDSGNNTVETNNVFNTKYNGTVTNCKHKESICTANATETHDKEVIGVNYALHECINANVSRTCTHLSTHTLRGLLKGCAEQNALGAIAAQGHKYTEITDVYVMSRHSNPFYDCKVNSDDNVFPQCEVKEDDVCTQNSEKAETTHNHLESTSSLSTTEQIDHDHLHNEKLHLCNRVEIMSNQKLQNQITKTISKNGSCTHSKKAMPVCFPCPLCWRYLCQVNTWKEEEKLEKKEIEEYNPKSVNGANISVHNKQHNCTSSTKTVNSATPLNLFIACDNISMLMQAVALAKSRALTVRPSSMKITFVLMNDNM